MNISFMAYIVARAIMALDSSQDFLNTASYYQCLSEALVVSETLEECNVRFIEILLTSCFSVLLIIFYASGFVKLSFHNIFRR